LITGQQVGGLVIILFAIYAGVGTGIRIYYNHKKKLEVKECTP